MESKTKHKASPHSFFLKYNEYLLMAAAILLFWVSPVLLRAIDPTAGSYDIGVLQIPITAIISFCIFQSVVWITLKLNWLSLRTYFEQEFINDFKHLPAWLKIIISLSVYFLLMFSLVLLNQVIQGQAYSVPMPAR
ncbi:hypothetical protein [Mucilaginibacter auburnensis]|uniref:hypothetical protein n=1 Tax=Mucilaginibacter auburnensis TaxID=1457233 RepID=UPI0012FE775E|nr:hypothetical protein [Mucilaginibacter auburnensis]